MALGGIYSCKASKISGFLPLSSLSSSDSKLLSVEELDSDSVKSLQEPALDLGVEYSQKLKEFLFVESDASYIPSINDFSDFLFRKDTALMIALSEKQEWKLRSGLAGTYNSTPVPGKEEMDLKYYIRMIYEFD